MGGGGIVTFGDETMHHSTQTIGAKKLCHLLKKKAIGAVVVLNNSPTHSQTTGLSTPAEL